jgi:hypothetical protein
MSKTAQTMMLLLLILIYTSMDRPGPFETVSRMVMVVVAGLVAMWISRKVK